MHSAKSFKSIPGGRPLNGSPRRKARAPTEKSGWSRSRLASRTEAATSNQYGPESFSKTESTSQLRGNTKPAGPLRSGGLRVAPDLGQLYHRPVACQGLPANGGARIGRRYTRHGVPAATRGSTPRRLHQIPASHGGALVSKTSSRGFDSHRRCHPKPSRTSECPGAASSASATAQHGASTCDAGVACAPWSTGAEAPSTASAAP